MTPNTVLLVDNNLDYRESVRWFLEKEGFHILETADPAEAILILQQGKADLAILDIRLINDQDEKDISGLTLARQIPTEIPKIILTEFPSYEYARDALAPQLNDQPLAIDFVAKREGPQALLTAVRKGFTLWSRQHSTMSLLGDNIPDRPSSPKLWLDEKNRAVVVHDDSVPLTPQEYEIMAYFFDHPNQVISHEEIVSQAIKENYDGLIEENRVNNIIRRIRQKIEGDSSKPQFLQTVRGHGFKLVL